MIARTRLLRVSVVTVAVVLSGGAAFAVAGGATPDNRPSFVDEVTTTSSELSTSTTAETVVDTSTTTTSFGDTTTSTSVETTTTTVESTTTSTLPDTTGCKPGWGYGDKNHCHSGPPGQAKKHEREGDASDACKPGWGYGDKNHCHSGPPGRNRP
jgi:hypothetical protein